MVKDENGVEWADPVSIETLGFAGLSWGPSNQTLEEKKMKIVINGCYGGFGLSPEACLWLFKHGFDEPGFKTPVEEYYKNDNHSKDSILSKKIALQNWRHYLKSGERASLFLTVFTPDEKFVLYNRGKNRAHPLLIKCVEMLGEEANAQHAKLKIIEIPDGTNWEIDEYDGMERVAEKHRTWG